MVGNGGNLCDPMPIARDGGCSTIQATVIPLLLRNISASCVIFQVSEERLIIRKIGMEEKRIHTHTCVCVYKTQLEARKLEIIFFFKDTSNIVKVVDSLTTLSLINLSLPK